MNATRTLQVTTPSEREIALTRVFDAPRKLVFDAWTKPDLLKRWLTGPPGWTLAVCDIDVRVGGAIRFVWQNDDGREMGLRGAYREIVRPERLVHTELFDEDWTGGETVVTNIMIEENGRTTLTMMVLYGSHEARDAAIETNMAAGVGTSFDHLEELLSEEASR